MTIKVKVQNNYGKKATYALDDGFIANHWKLTGHKTLTDTDIKAYKYLGIDFEVETPKI